MSASNYSWGTKKNEKWRLTSSKVIDLGWLWLTPEKVAMSVQTMDSLTRIHLSMSISAAKSPEFASFRRWNRTERKFRFTWLWKWSHRSKVIVGTVLNFQEKCKIVETLGIPSLASQVILGNPRVGEGKGTDWSTNAVNGQTVSDVQYSNFANSHVQYDLWYLWR